MKLIEKLGTRIDKNGYFQSWGLFICNYCKEFVERKLGAGLRQKSCGCVSNKLKSEAKKGEKNPQYGKKGIESPNFGKKFTEEHINNISEAKKGKYVGENNPFYGKKHTEYTIQKIKENMPSFSGENNPNIDYDKKNNNSENLITLCRKCHGKTSSKFNRDFWINYYKEIREVYL